MTKGGLHCFGRKDGEFVDVEAPPKPVPGKIAALEIVPAEFARKWPPPADFGRAIR